MEKFEQWEKNLKPYLNEAVIGKYVTRLSHLCTSISAVYFFYWYPPRYIR